MRAYRYQFILLGGEDALIQATRALILARATELGLDPDTSISLIDSGNFCTYEGSSPAVAVYFGEEGTPGDVAHVEALLADSVTVVPAVRDLERFQQLVPDVLHGVNGMQVDDSEERLEALTGLLLESLKLLRASRRLFISYKRSESRSVAIQLYEELDGRGFDVFLDTVSIRPGEPFQDELWHRLSDTDVVVLLDTPGFLASRWTAEELAQASAMSIGIVQVVWPGHSAVDHSSLAFRHYLEEGDFRDADPAASGASLTEPTVVALAALVESLRARSLAARQDGLVKEFREAARAAGYDVAMNPERYLSLESRTGEEIAVIPTVGVPQALRYQEVADLIAALRRDHVSRMYLVYDQRNLRDKWLAHLRWLDQHLPVKGVPVTGVEDWARAL